MSAMTKPRNGKFGRKERYRQYVDEVELDVPDRRVAGGFIARSLVVLFAILGLLFAVSTAYSFEVSPLIIVGVSVAALAIFALLRQLPFGKLICTGALAIFIVVFTLIYQHGPGGFLESLKFGYNYILDSVIAMGAKLAFLKNMDITLLIQDDLQFAAECQAFFIVLAVLVAYMMVITFYRSTAISPYVICSFALLAPGFYFTLLPSVIAFTFIIAACVGFFVLKMYNRIYNRRSMLVVRIYRRIREILPGKNHVPFRKKGMDAGGVLETVHTNIKRDGKLGMISFIASMICLVVITVVSLFVPENSAWRIQPLRDRIMNLRNYVVGQIYQNNIEGFDQTFAGLDGSQSLSLAPPNFYNLPVLEVQSQTGYPIYLRTWIGKFYSNNSWRPIDDAHNKELKKAGLEKYNTDTQMSYYLGALSGSDIFDPMFARRQGAFVDYPSVKVLYKKGKIAPVPVMPATGVYSSTDSEFTLSGDTLMNFSMRTESPTYSTEIMIPYYQSPNGAAIFESNLSKYQLIKQIVMQNGTIPNGEMMQYSIQNIPLENKYEQFVNQNYLFTPTNLSNNLRSLAQSLTANQETRLQKATAVANYLSDQSRYKYTKTPSTKDYRGGDIIEYFLFSSKEGYCTHFASAMTLMMRSVGVPARYVTGFVARPEGNKTDGVYYTTKLKDTDAHAWVEVYFPGMGWVPFEPTPGYNQKAFRALGLSSDEQQLTVSEIYRETPSEFMQEDPPEPEDFQQKEAPDLTLQIIIIAIEVIAIAAAIFLLIFLLMLLIKKLSENHNQKRLESFSTGDPTQTTRQAIGYLVALLRTHTPSYQITQEDELEEYFDWRIKMKYRDVVGIIYKALYSRHELTEAERKRVVDYTKALSVYIFNTYSYFKRAFYKFKL